MSIRCAVVVFWALAVAAVVGAAGPSLDEDGVAMLFPAKAGARAFASGIAIRGRTRSI